MKRFSEQSENLIDKVWFQWTVHFYGFHSDLCAVSHSQIIHSWFAWQELKFREKFAAPGSCKPHSFHRVTVVKNWATGKSFAVSDCCFQKMKSLVTTNDILPLSQQVLPSWAGILWQWGCGSWCPCSVLGKGWMDEQERDSITQIMGKSFFTVTVEEGALLFTIPGTLN